MHKNFTSPWVLILLIALLVVPTVAAPIDETEFIIEDTRYEFDKQTFASGDNYQRLANFTLVFNDYNDLADIQTIFWRPYKDVNNFALYDENIRTELYNVLFKLHTTDNFIGSGTLTYYKGSTTEQSYVRIDVDSIDVSLMDNPKIMVVINDVKPFNLMGVYGETDQQAVNYLSTRPATSSVSKPLRGTIEIEYYNRFTHTITLEEYDENNYNINIDRAGTKLGTPLGRHSSVTIYDKNGNLLYTNTDSSLVNAIVNKNRQPYTLTVKSTAFDKIYTGYLGSGEPWIPPEEESKMTVYREGSVTMTDHNGTSIRGFEVTAINAYTGKGYTATTETDVATITLPMDQTITMRNPQTGQYEDVPVGYYTFFVSKPGYKMTSEDGVRISVMPVEYSSYHLGDIIVTSEDGYLTGKHQFQIRSRADLSILQTGTISAQSATTGEWFNTTVTDGIATLILPYDTSNPYYEYVGNYYVYATSPGYIPSEYATQISVRPDTQSEIRWILLTPIGGIPEPGNVTLRIQAVSDSGQGIPNAEIHIDGVDGAGWEIWESYTTSATGYAEISVPENSTYDITVYGEGYYSSSQRIEVFTEDPPLLNIILYPTGAPTLTPPTTQPTGWVTPPPTTQPPGGIPDEDDDSEGFLMEAVRGISKAFGVGFATGKTIFGMLLALAIGFATAKQLRGGAAEFGLGLLGGTMLGVLIGLLPVWTIVVLLLVVGMYIGYRYVGGSNNG